MNRLAPRQQHGNPLCVKSLLDFAGFLLPVYILPPLLIVVGIVPFGWRFQMLVSIAVLVLIYSLLRGNSLADLGFRRDTLRRSLNFNLAVTLAALLAITILCISGVLRAAVCPQWRWFFLFYVLVSCPAQEFLFRSAIFAEMKRTGIESRACQIAVSTLAYCYLHVIYKDAATLGVTLLIGAVWGIGYSIHRNFWGVTVSHCILGSVSIYTGLI